MQLRNGKVTGYQIQNDMCPICLDLLYMPTKVFPCRHNFCNPCIRKVKQLDLNKSITCPICRTEIDKCSYDQNMEDNIKLKYPKELRERKKYEEKHCVHSPLPERVELYEKFSFCLICLPIDVLNVIFLCLFLVLKMLSVWFSPTNSSFEDELIDFTYSLWEKFRLYLQDVTEIMNGIRGSTLYRDWKKHLSILICCIWVLITHIIMTKLNKELRLTTFSTHGRCFCNVLLIIEYIFTIVGCHSLSQTLMTIARELETDML